MNGIAKGAQFFMGSAAGLSLLLCAASASAQQTPETSLANPAAVADAQPGNGSPAPEVAATPEADARALELSFAIGASVATIQTDGNAATGLLVGGRAAYRQGMLLLGATFDIDPGVSSVNPGASEDRSGWHLGFTAGPAFALNAHARLDLSGEVGLHYLSDNTSSSSSSYSTSASLPYFGIRPAISTEFGQGKLTGAVGVAAFFRVDAGQKQPNGLPDDGGHQLGLEAFLSLRIALFGG